MATELKVPDRSRYESWTYKQITDRAYGSEAVRLINVQGIATRHEVWMISREGGWPEGLLYIVCPDSGPYHFLVERWPNQPNRINRWDLDVKEDPEGSEALTREVLHWVVDQAQDEVKQEMS